MPDFFNTLDLPSGVDTRGLLTVGEETLSRELATSTTLSITSGDLRLTHFQARKTQTVTQARVLTGNTAAGATPTLCRWGLYLLDNSTGDGTLVASIPNDTALFAAASTTYTRSFSASYTLSAGARYAFGLIVVTAAATPTFVGVSPAGASSPEGAMAPRLSGTLTGQTDLVNSFAAASLTVANRRLYAVVLP